MMIYLPPSDQASSEGPALIPVVGNNTEKGGVESVLSNQLFFISQLDLYMLLQLWETSIYGIVSKAISVYH